MDLSMHAAGPSAPVADLRPSADAAATARAREPAGSVVAAPQTPRAAPATPPPSPVQAGLVSRAALEAGAAPPQRVLKPFGVTLLPSDERAGAARPPADPGRPAGPAGGVGEDAPEAGAANEATDGTTSGAPAPHALAAPAAPSNAPAHRV